MQLSSALLGDLADLFQDSRIEDVKVNAAAAVSTSRRNQFQIVELSKELDRRCGQLERDNAVMGLLVGKLIKVLAEEQPEKAAAVLAEVRSELVAAKGAATIDPLRTALDLPKPAKVSVSRHVKPTFKRPTRKAAAPSADGNAEPNSTGT